MRITFSKIVFACVLLVGAAYGIGIFRGAFGVGGYRSIAVSDEKRREIDKLERQNEDLVRENEAKKAYLDDLAKNPDRLKLKIQDSYKLVTPGTKEFIVQDGGKDDKPADSKPGTTPRP